jgi:hypothetical protein
MNMNRMMSVQAAADLIRAGHALSLAGPEQALAQLPPGRWVGGTIPYFMLAEGGAVVRDDRVFVNDLSTLGEVSFASYTPDALAGLTADAPDNGFALTILPAGSSTHQRFAAEASQNPDALIKPTVGWIAGVHLDELGSVTPKVYDGRTAQAYEDRAVVAFVSLPADKLASIEIVNLFEPDSGDVLTFEDTSFNVTHCRVNGERVHFGQYIRSRGLDHGQLPLVGDYAGANINVSLQSVEAGEGAVHLYAPVFPGVDYRFAKPVPDYAAAFRARLAEQDTTGTAMSCNCILNFLFGELEGKAIGGVAGPITFGEIAYQLLNQTLVLVRVQ